MELAALFEVHHNTNCASTSGIIRVFVQRDAFVCMAVESLREEDKDSDGGD